MASPQIVKTVNIPVISGPRGAMGPIGMRGKPGIGIAGKDGRDGIDGRNGRDGIDGKTIQVVERTILDMAALEKAKAELLAQVSEALDRVKKLEKRKSETTYIGGGGDPNPVKELAITFDGGGSVLTTGQVNIFYTIPYDATIMGWSLTGSPTGSLIVDVWKAFGVIPTVANTIVGATPPTITANQIQASNNLLGWNTSVRQGDIFEFSITSVASITKACLVLKLLKR
jgi:hypothetical protein